MKTKPLTEKISRASYKEAIEWILLNDCPESEDTKGYIVTSLIADLFKVSEKKVLKDVFNLKRKLVK